MGCIPRGRPRAAPDRAWTAAAVQSGLPGARPGARCTRGHRARAIVFFSSPNEWTFGGLRDAALLTLDAQLDALEDGWTLRDASAYNVQFRGGRPILIDSLSFEPHEDGAPWVAYRQFCEHFLAPLALMARRDVRLAHLLRAEIDGIPLDLAASLLPWRTRLNFGLLSHVHLHARSHRRHAGNEDEGEAARPAPSAQPPVALIGNLRSRSRASTGRRRVPNGRITPSTPATTTRPPPTRTASSRGSSAWYRRAGVGPGRQHRPLQPDRRRGGQASARVRHRPGRGRAALPRPPSGGEDRHPAARPRRRQPESRAGLGRLERRSLLERADADVVLALALVHHLAISRNVPLPMLSGCSPTSLRGRSSSSCRARTPWSAACSPRAGTSSTTTRSTRSGRGRRAVRGRPGGADREGPRTLFLLRRR